jgi:hypothetical protein
LVGVGREVAVFHRGQTRAELPDSARQIEGDRHHLADHREAFHHYGPEIVVDLIAYTDDDARGLIATFRGLDRRVVVISSGDVYLAYGRIVRTGHVPILSTPLTEESPLRSVLFPYRPRAEGPVDFPASPLIQAVWASRTPFSGRSPQPFRRRRRIIGTDCRVACFGRTPPTRARRLADASVDQTEARNDILGCFGRSDRRAQRHGLQANMATRRPSAKADQFGAREPE